MVKLPGGGSSVKLRKKLEDNIFSSLAICQSWRFKIIIIVIIPIF
jgi:hypothetical protein